ncbi:MAG: GNAT family N-acetyltransferase [Pyrinomonadaceae bacterium]
MFEIRGEKIRLRRFRMEDISLVFEAVRASARETSVWLNMLHADYSLEDARSWVSVHDEKWDTGTDYSFAISDLHEDNVLGVVDFNEIHQLHKIANLGYWVRTNHTKQGIATEAVKLAARFGFEELNFRRIEIVVAVGNTASQKIAEKVGARREGVLRNRLTIKNLPHDAVMNSLIPEDFGIEFNA